MIIERLTDHLSSVIIEGGEPEKLNRQSSCEKFRSTRGESGQLSIYVHHHRPGFVRREISFPGLVVVVVVVVVVVAVVVRFYNGDNRRRKIGVKAQSGPNEATMTE